MKVVEVHNYDVDEMEGKKVNFQVEIKYCKDLKVINVIYQVEKLIKQL